MMVYRFITITSGAQEVRTKGGGGGGGGVQLYKVEVMSVGGASAYRL